MHTKQRLLKNGKALIQVEYGIDYAFARRHNQSPYFSITGTTGRLAERGEKHDSDSLTYWTTGQRFMWDTGGCIHDEIARYFRTLQPLIDLHGCNIDGAPSHAVPNTAFFVCDNRYDVAVKHLRLPADIETYFRRDIEQLLVDSGDTPNGKKLAIDQLPTGGIFHNILYKKMQHITAKWAAFMAPIWKHQADEAIRIFDLAEKS